MASAALKIRIPCQEIIAPPELPVIITSKVTTLCPHIIPKPDSQSPRVEIRVTTEYQEFERLIYQTSTTPYREVTPVTESQPFNPLCEECYSRRKRYLLSLGIGQRAAKQSLSKLRDCLSGLIEMYEGYRDEERKELTLVLSLVRLIDRPCMDEEEYVSWVERVSFETAAEEAGSVSADVKAVAKLDVVDEAETGGGGCENNCGVCLDELKGEGGLIIRRMPCQHVFHEGCIFKWLSNSYFCPLCRFELPKGYG